MSDNPSFAARIGEQIAFPNRNNVAIRYRVDFGDAGAVIFTVQPGADFTVTVGTGGPQVYVEDTSQPGLQLL